jgi:two-component system cell cycle sensor histidine kinase PleC
MREVSIGEVLSASASSFRLMAQSAGVRLDERIDPSLPIILGDNVKLRQVFTNLISNALKFTRSGGSVTVKARQGVDGGVVVEICDTGIGMSEQDVAVALTPFGQVDASHARWREGTGLGLPIAKALVQLHDGNLTIRSKKDVGTEVMVMLPARTEHSVKEPREAYIGQGLPT